MKKKIVYTDYYLNGFVVDLFLTYLFTYKGKLTKTLSRCC